MADKPGHIVEISDALGRDVDKAREGKLKKALPIEAFMSQGALDELAARQRPKTEPVRADQLQAISPVEAARRRTFSGESLPEGIPQVRRVIPAPFRRPSATIGSNHGKTWRTLTADKIRTGDIVPDLGEVSVVREEVVRRPKGEVLGFELRSRGGAGRLWHKGGQAVLGEARNAELDEPVAVGVAILVFGAQDQVKAFREYDEVQVFRKHEDEG